MVPDHRQVILIPRCSAVLVNSSSINLSSHVLYSGYYFCALGHHDIKQLLLEKKFSDTWVVNLITKIPAQLLLAGSVCSMAMLGKARFMSWWGKSEYC